MIDRQFGKELRLLCPSLERVRITHLGARGYYYHFPDIRICHQEFETAICMEIDWEDQEGPDEPDEMDNNDTGDRDLPADVLALVR